MVKVNFANCKCRGKKTTLKDSSFEATISRKKIKCFMKLPICNKCGNVKVSEIKLFDVIKRAADFYRSKEGLLTSTDLRQTRENYKMSQSQFADFIGVPCSALSSWEMGDTIQERAYDELIRIKTDSSYMAQVMCRTQGVSRGEVGRYSGYRSLNRPLLKNILLYLIDQVKTSKLFLNNILFYIDFKHFKDHGLSITGSSYVPLEYGPCPENYASLFADLVNEGSIEEGVHYQYKTKKEADLELLDRKEKMTLEYVIDLAKADGGRNLFNLSHMEKGFLATSVGKPISYTWAKSLKI